MIKPIFDNRFVGVAFVLLLFVNAYAITNGRLYAEDPPGLHHRRATIPGWRHPR